MCDVLLFEVGNKQLKLNQLRSLTSLNLTSPHEINEVKINFDNFYKIDLFLLWFDVVASSAATVSLCMSTVVCCVVSEVMFDVMF